MRLVLHVICVVVTRVSFGGAILVETSYISKTSFALDSDVDCISIMQTALG